MTDRKPESNETPVPEASETIVSEISETTVSETSETTARKTPAEDAWHVTLPDDLGAKIDRRVSETNFDSADEYVAFVLESLLREIDQQDGDVVVDVREEAPDDADHIQDRLESLGYL